LQKRSNEKIQKKTNPITTTINESTTYLLFVFFFNSEFVFCFFVPSSLC